MMRYGNVDRLIWSSSIPGAAAYIKQYGVVAFDVTGVWWYGVSLSGSCLFVWEWDEWQSRRYEHGMRSYGTELVLGLIWSLVRARSRTRGCRWHYADELWKHEYNMIYVQKLSIFNILCEIMLTSPCAHSTKDHMSFFNMHGLAGLKPGLMLRYHMMPSNRLSFILNCFDAFELLPLHKWYTTNSNITLASRTEQPFTVSLLHSNVAIINWSIW